MAFGVFDGCDEGHRFFLRTAAKLGSKFIVVVARDETVERLKQKSPLHSLEERVAAIEALGVASAVVPGDQAENSWEVLRTHQPDVIALGHDQEALDEALKGFPIEIRIVKKYVA